MILLPTSSLRQKCADFMHLHSVLPSALESTVRKLELNCVLGCCAACGFTALWVPCRSKLSAKKAAQHLQDCVHCVMLQSVECSRICM